MVAVEGVRNGQFGLSASGVLVYHGGANGILFTGTEGKIEVNRGYFKTWPEKIGQTPIGPNDVHLYKTAS